MSDYEDESDGGNKVMAKIVLGFIGLTAVGTALFFAVAPAKSAELLPENFLTQAVAPSIQIGKFCSGTIIHSDRDKESGEAETIILSAKHCVKTDQRLDINIAEHNNGDNRVTSEVSWKAIVTGTSYKSDLALIKLLDKMKVFTHVAKVADKDIKLSFGQRVYTVSFPLGLSKTYTEGNLGYVDYLEGAGSTLNSNSNDFYRATPSVAGGSSGSGLFVKTDSGDYQLIGTLTAGYTVGTFANLYTPIEEIRDYIDTASKSWKSSEPKADEKKDEKKDFDKKNTWERAN